MPISFEGPTSFEVPFSFEAGTALLLANLAILLGVVVQASAGIGFAMIAVPLLALIDLTFVPGPLLIVLLCLALVMTWQERGDIDWRGLPSLLPGLLVGTVTALLLLRAFDPARFGLLFGIVLLLAVALSVFGRMPVPGRLGMFGGGLAAGLMGTISGIHGPPLALLYQRAELARARATIAAIFGMAAIASLAGLWQAKLMASAQLMTGLSLLPGLVVGYALAHVIRGRLPVVWLRRAMLWLATLSAVSLIIAQLH